MESNQEQYDAVAQAVAGGADLGSTVAPQHSGPALRDFLTRLLARMDQLRPWAPAH